MAPLTPTAADLSALLVELAGMPEFLAARLGSLTSEEAALAGRRGAFSPVEHCWHLADLEGEGYRVRIERLLHESEPSLLDFDGARLAEERHYRRKPLAEGLRALWFRTPIVGIMVSTLCFWVSWALFLIGG